MINEGGIGYGIRRLIAERAVSARDGVNPGYRFRKEVWLFCKKVGHIQLQTLMKLAARAFVRQPIVARKSSG